MFYCERTHALRSIRHAPYEIYGHWHHMCPISFSLGILSYDTVERPVHPLYHPVSLGMIGGCFDMLDTLLL